VPFEGRLAWRSDLLDNAPHAGESEGSAEHVGMQGVPQGLLFLPQRPYCPVGSLREQLLYPRRAQDALEWDAQRLREVLETVDLGQLIERVPALAGAASRHGAASGTVATPAHAPVSSTGGPYSDDEVLDMVCDWSDVLSLGEQQRLAFARVLTNQPALALLDESTSALDMDTEAAMYKLLKSVPGLTYVSVGHRPSLRTFHKHALDLGKPNPTPKPIADDARAADASTATTGTASSQQQQR